MYWWRLVPFEAIALALKGRNLGRQWQPTTHPFVTPSLLPRLPHHLFHRYDAPDASLTRGDNVACCGFARTTDPPRRWCHFLILGPGEWHQRLTTALRRHGGGGSGGGTIVSCWCL
mmetsp:Transcript_27256/g.39487  ORF Transcript_27256/g.39487 Transcript_27256/m.39487 type:complete len:116 (+) Transcript_27256:302-649(+)